MESFFMNLTLFKQQILVEINIEKHPVLQFWIEYNLFYQSFID